jgi:predicted dehydrogenase
MGDIGWCKDPYTSPSSLRYARKGDKDFINAPLHGAWFPDGFGGTMSQLLIAIEQGDEPDINGRDNLMTMALVDAAYLSAFEHSVVDLAELTRKEGVV